jgi:pSer/pThr/pTyr-binding forkhead associated (FHA) protein
MSSKLIGLTGLSKGMTVILDESECFIGRAPTNQLRLSGDLVSRQHCVIRKVGDQFVVEDQSTNGTFVNNEPVKKRSLAHFDHLTIGDSVFIFLLDEGAGESRSRTAAVRFYRWRPERIAEDQPGDQRRPPAPRARDAVAQIHF